MNKATLLTVKKVFVLKVNKNKKIQKNLKTKPLNKILIKIHQLSINPILFRIEHIIQ